VVSKTRIKAKYLETSAEKFTNEYSKEHTHSRRSKEGNKRLYVQRKTRSSGQRIKLLRNKEEGKIEAKGNKNKMKRHERAEIKSNTSVPRSLCYAISLAKLPGVICNAHIHPVSPYRGFTKQHVPGED
jgi:hypothetical protein